MAKPLTLQQLQFIDKYLKDSGVRYDDIRYEMTDHVATSIENMDGDFNENFRQYMDSHRKDLFESDRAFRKLALDKAFSILGKNLVSYTLAITTLIIFATSCIATPFLGEENIADSLHLTMLMMASFVYFYFLYYKIFGKTSHSLIDRILTILFFGSIFVRLDKYIENPSLITFYYSFSIAFFIVALQTIYKLRQHYKLRYNG
jgi:hypothetical protein